MIKIILILIIKALFLFSLIALWLVTRSIHCVDDEYIIISDRACGLVRDLAGRLVEDFAGRLVEDFEKNSEGV